MAQLVHNSLTQLILKTKFQKQLMSIVFLRGQPVFQMKILGGPHNIEVPVIVGGDNRLICDVALTVFLKKQGRFQLFDFETDKNRCHIAERSCHWEIQDRGMSMGYRYSCNPFLPWNEVITEQLY
ncbi:hypothetical protein P3L10_017832 [Capsicum annuum]